MAREDTDTGYVRIPLTLVAGASGTVLAAIAGQKIKLISLFGAVTATGSVQLFSNTTALTGDIPVSAASPFGFRADPREPWLVTAAGEALKLKPTTGDFRGVAVVYVEG